MIGILIVQGEHNWIASYTRIKSKVMGLYTISKIPTRLFTNRAFIRRRQSFSTIVVVWRFLMIVSQGKLHFVSLHCRSLVPVCRHPRRLYLFLWRREDALRTVYNVVFWTQELIVLSFGVSIEMGLINSILRPRHRTILDMQAGRHPLCVPLGYIEVVITWYGAHLTLFNQLELGSDCEDRSLVISYRM